MSSRLGDLLQLSCKPADSQPAGFLVHIQIKPQTCSREDSGGKQLVDRAG